MTDILNAIQHQGLAFVILSGILLALYRGDIIMKGHFEDYKGQRDEREKELRRELAEKDQEIAAWQQVAQSGPPATQRAIDIAKDLLSAAKASGPTP